MNETALSLLTADLYASSVRTVPLPPRARGRKVQKGLWGSDITMFSGPPPRHSPPTGAFVKGVTQSAGSRRQLTPSATGKAGQ
jgi:hypothetical protein